MFDKADNARAANKNDVEQMTIAPVQTVKQNIPLPRVPQYKISPEGEQGMETVKQDLLRNRAIRDTGFPMQ